MDALKKKHIITGLSISLAPFVMVPLMSYIYQQTLGEILRNGIFSMFFSLALAYFWIYSIKTNRFDYDNLEHPYRFLIVYMASFLLCLLFPLINSAGWVYLSIAITLTLFSNSLLGMYIAPCFIMFSILLKGENDIVAFFVYFVAVFIGIVLFQDIDQSFDVIHSIMISIICLFVFETAGFVLLKNSELSFEQFIIPVVNAVVNVLVIFWSLKYFNEFVANKYRNKYLELNDQEYKVLVELKQKSSKEYFRSIHTAYLVERMAAATECNVDIAKNLAYYHRIKRAYSLSKSGIDRFITDNGFPPECAEVITRFWDKNKALVTKEECIVFISDKLISLLLDIFNKDKKAKVDYEELYDTLMQKDFMIEALADSDLTNKDMRAIRNIFLKEELYYDFLR